MNHLLECRGLTVDFGQQRAIDDLSLDVAHGEIIGLVGPNGAGKSTFGRVLVGEVPFGAYTGDLRFENREARFANARAAHEAGIALIHQEGAAVEQLSVGENVMLTIEPTRYGLVRWPALHAQARRALDQLGTATDTHQRLGDRSGVALMELVEVARALARGGKLFVFDESTAALGPDEIGTLLERMRELAAAGASVIFISHRIQEIVSVCDRVVVLRDGRKVLDAPRAGLDARAVIRSMLGSDPGRSHRVGADPRPKSSAPSGAPLLRIEGWRLPKSDLTRIDLGPVDLDVARGEVLGVFGPLGAGKTELLQSIYGMAGEVRSGRLQWEGVRTAPFSRPRDAIRSGLAFVSADRQKEGIVPQLSVLENMMLGHHRAELSWYQILLRQENARQLCDELIRQLGIRTQGPDQIISALSGGNQQKVLLARAMINSPRLLLLDEPTRGIDVGARRDVYRWIKDTAGKGTSVIVSSLDETELIGLADRIVVLRDGRQIVELSGAKVTEHELLTFAAGGTRH